MESSLRNFIICTMYQCGAIFLIQKSELWKKWHFKEF